MTHWFLFCSINFCSVRTKNEPFSSVHIHWRVGGRLFHSIYFSDFVIHVRSIPLQNNVHRCSIPKQVPSCISEVPKQIFEYNAFKMLSVGLVWTHLSRYSQCLSTSKHKHTWRKQNERRSFCLRDGVAWKDNFKDTSVITEGILSVLFVSLARKERPSFYSATLRHS